MSVLRRAKPSTRITQLTQQLAEDYDSVPLPQVSRVVQDAAATTFSTANGGADGIPTLLAEIEQVARQDLEWISCDQSRRTLKRAPAGQAHSAAHQSGPHRGVA